MAFYGSVPYVAFYSGKASAIQIKRQASSGIGWETVGRDIHTTGAGTNISLVINNSRIYIVYTANYINGLQITVKRLKIDGSDWELVGPEGFSTGQADAVSMAFKGTIPYVAFEDEANASKLTVMKLNTAGTAWEVVGKAGFSSDKIYYTSIAFNGSVPYVAYSEGSNTQAKVIKLNVAGTDWDLVGKNISAYPVTYLKLAFNGTIPYLAFEENRQKATVKKLNAAGTDWETVGIPGFTPGIATNISLAFNAGIPYVAYSDGFNSSKASVMKLNTAGTGWVNVGQAGISSGSVSFLAFAFNGAAPYLAFPDNGYLSKPRAMKLNDAGTAWEQLSSSGISAGYASALNIVLNGNTPYIAYRDNGNNNAASVMRYNLSKAAWENVANPGFTYQLSAVNKIPLAFNGSTPYTAFGDNAKAGKASVMKLNTAGTGWEAVGPAGFSAGSVIGQISLAVSGSTPYIVYGDQVLNVKRLNAAGTSWETVGNAFTATNIGNTSLLFKGTIPYVAFADGSHGGNVTVVRLNAAGTWETVGTPGFAGSEYFSMVFGGDIPYIVCTDNTGHKIDLYRLKADGSGWDKVGGVTSSDDSVSFVSLAFDGETPYISVVSGGNNAKVITLNASGTGWQDVGGYYVSSTRSLNTSIAILDHKIYLAYDSYGAFVKTYDLTSIQSAKPLLAGAGGTVTITGTNFTGATAVNFGGVAAQSFRVSSPTTITAVVGNGATGDIKVTTPANSATFKGFVYLAAPVINSFTPSSGANDAKITIIGNNFTGTTAVKFGTVAAASFVVNSVTSITATAGSGESGKISVVAPGGTAVSTTPFIYNAVPTIISFTPTTAPAGTTIKITGVNFTGATAVSFGGVPARSFAVTLATEIIAIVDAGSKTGKISLTTPGGTTTSAATLTFVTPPAPIITSFTPTQATGGIKINLTGTGFTGATSVSFGGVQATGFSVYSDTQLAASVSDNGASGDVIVVTPAGTGSIKGFVFLKPTQISSFSPATAAEGSTITINGQGFTAATGISFGNTPASSFLVNSDTRITAITGKGSSGAVNVSTPNGKAVADGFIFLTRPIITPLGQTTFTAGGSVMLGTSTATGNTYQWIQDGKIVSLTDKYLATTAGSYTVKVTNSGITLTSDPVVITVIFDLPADNFKVSATSVTCKGENNGIIHITAIKNLNYTVSIAGSGLNQLYPFTNDVSIGNLLPGTYSACITVAGQTAYQQCFELVISQPQDLSVFSTVNKRTSSLNLALNGSDKYAIELNGISYNTSESSITLPLQKGNNKLVVATDKPCQGVIEKIIGITDNLSPYPNPFQDILNVNLGDVAVASCTVKIYNIADGRLLYQQKLGNCSGVIQLELTLLKSGIYSLNMTMDNRESVYKIIKK